MIAEIMRSLNNFFETAYVDGDFTIENGVISPCAALDDECLIAVQDGENRGVWACSGGTIYANDGKSPVNDTFSGRVYILHPPGYFIDLCHEIEAYKEKNPAGNFVQESFGGWSGTRAQGAHGVQSWQEAFADRLKPHRRMFTEVRL